MKTQRHKDKACAEVFYIIKLMNHLCWFKVLIVIDFSGNNNVVLVFIGIATFNIQRFDLYDAGAW